MTQQTVKIKLADGEVRDIRPIGSGVVISSMIFLTSAGEYQAIPNGAVVHTRDNQGNVVFRLTAPADMDGWFHFTESLTVYPDPVTL